MFLIAGVQPRVRRLDDTPQRCPACGSREAHAARVDHYFSLFFIPLIRVKKGTPFLQCDRCQRSMGDAPTPEPAPPLAGSETVCVACGKRFDRSFKYCPHCGQRA